MTGIRATMSDVKFEKVEKRYGAHIAVRDFDLDVQPGEFLTLLGPSGCGKTTCLRMVAGFIAPTGGRILMAGRDVTALPAYRRKCDWHSSVADPRLLGVVTDVA